VPQAAWERVAAAGSADCSTKLADKIHYLDILLKSTTMPNVRVA